MSYRYRIKIVTIYENFFSHLNFFLQNFFKSLINRKEPEQEMELELIISAISGRQFNFGCLTLGSSSGSATLTENIRLIFLFLPKNSHDIKILVT
jgi:hypothetical protein